GCPNAMITVWSMFCRLLSLSALLVLGAVPAMAQALPDNRPPEICRVTTNESMPELQARKQRLETAIANKGGTDARKDPGQELRKMQEDLLEVVAWIECAQVNAQPEIAVARRRSVAPSAVAATPPELVEVTTYYATNRNPTPQNSEPSKAYGNETESALHYG